LPTLSPLPTSNDQQGAKREANRTPSVWLRERLQQLAEQTTAAERPVVAFKQQNNIVSADGLTSTRGSLPLVPNHLSSGCSWASGYRATTMLTIMVSSLEQRVPLVDQVLFENVDRLPDQARYRPLGRKAMLQRIGLRGLDPALFERPKSGFVLPFVDSAWPEGRHGPDFEGPAGRRSRRPRSRSSRSALAGLPAGGTWSVLVSGVVHIRLCPMASPQSRFPVNQVDRGDRGIGFTVAVAAVSALLVLGLGLVLAHGRRVPSRFVTHPPSEGAP
jgi:hypothetical protein